MEKQQIRLGIIGFGGRMHGVMGFLCKLHRNARTAAIVDPRAEEIKAELKNAGDEQTRKMLGANSGDIRFYQTIDEMLDKAAPDGVLIGTRCGSHTDIAMQVMKRNIPIYLEKPVSINIEQVKNLYRASLAYKSEAVVSFPLKASLFVTRVRELVEAGEIGAVRQIQAINNVDYGAGYFKNHYRDFDETGGLWLQKATHDLDYISYIIGGRPVKVAALHSARNVFGGIMPAGLTCDKCDKYETCPESPFAGYLKRGENPDPKEKWKWLCAFGEDVGRLEEHGSCLIQYENGAQAVYTQNFYIRRKHARGAVILGYDGNIAFDFYEGKIVLTKHHSAETQTLEISKADGHAGGDTLLANNFIEVIRGTGRSKSPLISGIESAYLCLLCRESAEKQEFVKAKKLSQI